MNYLKGSKMGWDFLLTFKNLLPKVNVNKKTNFYEFGIFICYKKINLVRNNKKTRKIIYKVYQTYTHCVTVLNYVVFCWVFCSVL